MNNSKANLIIYVAVVLGVTLNIAGLYQGTGGGLVWAIFPYVLPLFVPSRLHAAKIGYVAVLLVLDIAFWSVAWTYQKSEILMMLSLLDTLKIVPAIVLAIVVMVVRRLNRKKL